MRILAASSRRLYEATLRRAFGRATPPFTDFAAVQAWPRPSLAILRAAVRRVCIEAGMEEEAYREILDKRIPDPGPRQTDVQAPPEPERVAYERAAMVLDPPHRALALLPLALGLRSRELLTLRRDDVERTVRAGADLRVLRKGNKVMNLPAASAKELLADLLTAPWGEPGEILSKGTFGARYRAYYRLVRRLGQEAGILRFRPHLLRHAFAGRFVDDGGDVRDLQAYLGHSDLRTTSAYLHADLRRGGQVLRAYRRGQGVKAHPVQEPRTGQVGKGKGDSDQVRNSRRGRQSRK